MSSAGGYIGVEMAENLKKAGLDVTIAELADHVIAPLDFDMAADVHHYLKAQGHSSYHRQRPFRKSARTVTHSRLSLALKTLSADMALLAVGVRPETGLAAACGISCGARGCILVNRRMQTNFPDIFAVGDAVQVNDFVTGAPAFIPLAGSPLPKRDASPPTTSAGCTANIKERKVPRFSSFLT